MNLNKIAKTHDQRRRQCIVVGFSLSLGIVQRKYTLFRAHTQHNNNKSNPAAQTPARPYCRIGPECRLLKWKCNAFDEETVMIKFINQTCEAYKFTTEETRTIFMHLCFMWRRDAFRNLFRIRGTTFRIEWRSRFILLCSGHVHKYTFHVLSFNLNNFASRSALRWHTIENECFWAGERSALLFAFNATIENAKPYREEKEIAHFWKYFLFDTHQMLWCFRQYYNMQIFHTFVWLRHKCGCAANWS